MNPVTLDKIDKGIIQLLAQDGRMPFSEMADRLKVTEKTIRSHFKNLIEQEIIKVTGVVNPISLGIKVVSIIQIQVAPQGLQYVTQHLINQKVIRFVTMTSGEFQLIVQSFHKTYEDLTEFLKELNTIDYVQRTNVIVQFEVYKNTFEYI